MKKKIAFLSNVMIELIRRKIKPEYDLFIPDGYDTWISEVINPMSRLNTTDYDAIIILLDGTEARKWQDKSEALDRVHLWMQSIDLIEKNKENVPIFVSDIDIRENNIVSYSEKKYAFEIENYWYNYISDKALNNANMYILDVKNLVLNVGRNNFYSDKMWYMSNMPYSKLGMECIAEEINCVLNTIFLQRKKMIVLDLDNTLWGGVIGEDGIDGIVLSEHKEGQRFYDFQRQLLEMKKRGILLSIVSKNNYDDAISAINDHPAMLLKQNDFVDMKINWNSKAENIIEIREDTNITEQGFIFVDDNPMEREIVRNLCSDVEVLDFPEDTSTLRQFAEDFYLKYCKMLRLSDEDKKKTEMYHSETERKREWESSLNLNEYIRKLEICVDIHRMRENETNRVLQLINKTNQFNLTTKRYTALQLKEITDNEMNDVYSVYCQDKYGDSGLVGVLVILNLSGKTVIDTFLLSCRVMGRMIENVIINELINYYKNEKGVSVIYGNYAATPKNKPVEDLYERLGFRLLSQDSEKKCYDIELNKYKEEDYSFFKNIRFMDR